MEGKVLFVLLTTIFFSMVSSSPEPSPAPLSYSRRINLRSKSTSPANLHLQTLRSSRQVPEIPALYSAPKENNKEPSPSYGPPKGNEDMTQDATTEIVTEATYEEVSTPVPENASEDDAEIVEDNEVTGTERSSNAEYLPPKPRDQQMIETNPFQHQIQIHVVPPHLSHQDKNEILRMGYDTQSSMPVKHDQQHEDAASRLYLPPKNQLMKETGPSPVAPPPQSPSREYQTPRMSFDEKDASPLKYQMLAMSRQIYQVPTGYSLNSDDEHAIEISSSPQDEAGSSDDGGYQFAPAGYSQPQQTQQTQPQNRYRSESSGQSQGAQSGYQQQQQQGEQLTQPQQTPQGYRSPQQSQYAPAAIQEGYQAPRTQQDRQPIRQSYDFSQYNQPQPPVSGYPSPSSVQNQQISPRLEPQGYSNPIPETPDRPHQIQQQPATYPQQSQGYGQSENSIEHENLNDAIVVEGRSEAPQNQASRYPYSSYQPSQSTSSFSQDSYSPQALRNPRPSSNDQEPGYSAPSRTSYSPSDPIAQTNLPLTQENDNNRQNNGPAFGQLGSQGGYQNQPAQDPTPRSQFGQQSYSPSSQPQTGSFGTNSIEPENAEEELEGLNGSIVDEALLQRVQQILEEHERQQKASKASSRNDNNPSPSYGPPQNLNRLSPPQPSNGNEYNAQPIDQRASQSFHSQTSNGESETAFPKSFTDRNGVQFQKAVLSHHFSETGSSAKQPQNQNEILPASKGQSHQRQSSTPYSGQEENNSHAVRLVPSPHFAPESQSQDIETPKPVYGIPLAPVIGLDSNENFKVVDDTSLQSGYGSRTQQRNRRKARRILAMVRRS